MSDEAEYLREQMQNPRQFEQDDDFFRLGLQ